MPAMYHLLWSGLIPLSFFPQEDACDLDAYTLAKSYFDLKEYDRAAYFLRNCKSPKAYFLYMYSRYLVSSNYFLSVSDGQISVINLRI